MNTRFALIAAAAGAAVLLAGCATGPSKAELDQQAMALMKASFRDQGIAKVDRLNQDLGQAACSTDAEVSDEVAERIRLQDLPNLTKNPGDGIGFAAWPAYRVSNGEMWSMQLRLNDCYRQQRFPYPGFGSEITVALGTYMGVNAKGAESIAPAIKR